MDNEYYSKEEARELIAYLRREIDNILRDHNQLLVKNEALQEEFNQLKERYINLAR
jgi:cell division septum initiation protein DivIVA